MNRSPQGGGGQRGLPQGGAFLSGDLTAGLTVAAYLIPQCMAYGELAGLAPINGLWAMLPAIVIYAWLGGSPQLSVGPETTTALMTAALVGPMVAAGDRSGSLALASLMALLVGLVCLLAALLKLAFLADLLSQPILVGYLAGVALLMIAGQMHTLTGIGPRVDSLGAALEALVQRHGAVHGPSLALAGLALLLMLMLRRWRPHLPGPLLVVLLATAASWLLHLDRQGVAMVGTIEAGLPALVLPTGLTLASWQPLMLGAVGIALVGYSDNMLTARSFAQRHGERIDATKELVALGVTNVATSLFQGFPVSSSNTRTALADAMGARSQRYSLVALVVVLAVLLWLRPLLAMFPRPVLGALVVFAALQLIDIDAFRRLQRFKRSEFLLALVTLLGVLFSGILSGVVVAVGLSVLDLFARVARPHDAVLGEVRDLAGFHDVKDWPGGSTVPGLVLYRYDAPLCFANANDFESRALAAIAAEVEPVQWFVLNAEAIIELDITAADMLAELAQELQQRGIRFAMTRVKQGLFHELERAGLVARLGFDAFYPTIPVAVAAFRAQASSRPTGAPG
ncbi:MAG: SulP family inorganic anion transporter [Cyanobacteriota bacterium]